MLFLVINLSQFLPLRSKAGSDNSGWWVLCQGQAKGLEARMGRDSAPTWEAVPEVLSQHQHSALMGVVSE